MLNQTLLDVLSCEGVVAIVTQGENKPHVVNTWHDYIIVHEDKLLIPAGKMIKTENNLQRNSSVLLTCGTKDIQGLHSMGTGFLVTGQATMEASGPLFEQVHHKFSWARAALVVAVESTEQTL